MQSVHLPAVDMSVLRLEGKKRVPTWEAEEMGLLDKGSGKTYFIDLGWADLNNLLKILKSTIPLLFLPFLPRFLPAFWLPPLIINYDSFTLADGTL